MNKREIVQFLKEDAGNIHEDIVDLSHKIANPEHHWDVEGLSHDLHVLSIEERVYRYILRRIEDSE